MGSASSLKGSLTRSLRDGLRPPFEPGASAASLRAEKITTPEVSTVTGDCHTTPFALLVQSLTIVWHALHGNPNAGVDRRLRQAPWHRTKTDPSYPDMAATLRRVIIAARYKRPYADQPTPEEITEIQLAWTDAAA